jgi:hypothetical protein
LLWLGRAALSFLKIVSSSLRTLLSHAILIEMINRFYQCHGLGLGFGHVLSWSYVGLVLSCLVVLSSNSRNGLRSGKNSAAKCVGDDGEGGSYPTHLSLLGVEEAHRVMVVCVCLGFNPLNYVRVRVRVRVSVRLWVRVRVLY